jgi:hypothetical protein
MNFGISAAYCYFKKYNLMELIMYKSSKTLSSLTLAIGLMAVSQANATLYSYDIMNPPGSAAAGDVTNFSTTYDDVTSQLTLSSTIAKSGGKIADGFWLVLSDGPNPKHQVNEYAILYGDAISGNLTSYVYSGQNNSNSWSNPGIFIESFTGGLSVDDSVTDEVTFSFSIDASTINSFYNTPDWDGVSFGDEIGIWYHPAVFGGNGPSYNLDGSLGSFPITSAGWYDTAYRDTTTVPEPGVFMLLISGLIGVFGVSRRRRA